MLASMALTIIRREGIKAGPRTDPTGRSASNADDLTKVTDMKNFNGKLAVVTGGGSGMGRDLCLQLAKEGCHVAMCDVSEENMQETRSLCEAAAPAGTTITTTLCDVSEQSQVLAFRDAVKQKHNTQTINLLFNNAGIGGAGSFINDTEEMWEKTFAVCWYGVYYNARAFMPMLVASESGHIVNTSSVNGFWASIGPGVAHTAYSAAKFAVKGFSEALINDLRLNAPHVKVSLVMPGHIGTSIVINSGKILGMPDPLDMSAEEIREVRESMMDLGDNPNANLSDEQLKQALHQQRLDFRDKAPMSASEAATVILNGVKAEKWRILVGDDAFTLDRMVRQNPEGAYEPEFFEQLLEQNVFGALSEATGSADDPLKDAT